MTLDFDLDLDGVAEPSLAESGHATRLCRAEKTGATLLGELGENIVDRGSVAQVLEFTTLKVPTSNTSASSRIKTSSSRKDNFSC